MKEFAPEDPMELVGVNLPSGDSDDMAECLVEEYLLMGWNERQLMNLFTRPFFQTTHRIYREQGEAYVQALIERVCDKWRHGRIRGGVCDA